MRRSLRFSVRFVALVLGFAALSATAALPASAEDITVSGPFTASGPFVFQCDFAQEFLTGSGDWTGLGSVALDFEFCVAIPPSGNLSDPWPVTRGTFTVTAADGTLSGDVSGFYMAGSNPGTGQLTFTVTSGTGRFARASGSIVLDFAIAPVPPFFRTIDGTAAGTITVLPPTPSSRADCQDGGWRDFADENGTPFRNQGECIAWVNQHT